MAIKKFFFDVETTGTNPMKHSMHQIAGYIEIDNIVVEKFNFKLKPHEKAEILEVALNKSGVTREQIMNYPHMREAYRAIKQLLGKYCDRYNPKDKFYLVGFNNNAFDNKFFNMLFTLCDDEWFWSWFWPDSLDTLSLSGQYLIERRVSMPDFKLKTVAAELGIVVDNELLHDAEYDIELTRRIYRIVTGIDVEL